MPVDTKIRDSSTTNDEKFIRTKTIANGNDVVMKVSIRRWLVLLTFSSISLISAFNWIEYNIIQDITVAFYNESLPDGSVEQNEAVNWMSMIYMLCYIPLVFPSMFLLDLKGLRICVAIGALFTCIGAWIKCAAVHPNRFAVAMLGQTFCAIAQAFTLGVPARLSSLWFGPSEISTATSIGVFGNQLGTALGFLIPPSVIPGNATVEVVTARFYYMLVPVAGVCTFLFILSVIGI
jgi:FLVCR family feline leukemia virus subgroup C receptor-related protein